MPPRAIASSVSSDISRSPRASSSSIIEAGGNFGARPNPPLTRSYVPHSEISASRTSSWVIGSTDGSSLAVAPSASTIRTPWLRICSRRLVQASATPSSTIRQLGSPWRDSGGKYVPT